MIARNAKTHGKWLDKIGQFFEQNPNRTYAFTLCPWATGDNPKVWIAECKHPGPLRAPQPFVVGVFPLPDGHALDTARAREPNADESYAAGLVAQLPKNIVGFCVFMS